MRIELLGAGGYHPTHERHTACVLLPELGLMLDAGTGAHRVHERAGDLRGDRLDVLLTHAHLDHVVGLTYLLGLNHEGRPIETVVHARPETMWAVREHLLAPQLFPIQPVTSFSELPETLHTIHGAKVTNFPLDHPGGSVGLRIDTDDKSIAYVTDTRRVTHETIERIRDVDLLLHEAYFPNAQHAFAKETGHCTAEDAAWAAVEAAVGRLVLVHADPRGDDSTRATIVEEARRHRPDADFAHDDQVIEV